MQIREKGKKVLCIKTQYDPDKKRTYGRTVASQDKSLTSASEEVCRHLKKEEVDQLNSWLSEREKEKSAVSRRVGLLLCNDYMANAADALDDGSELSDEHAAEIIEAMNRLKKSLRKRGYKVTQQTKKQSASPVEDERQLSLDNA